MELAEVEELLNEVRQTFKGGKTRSFSWRKRQLEGILEFLHDKEQDIFSALKQDLGKHKVEAFRDEVGILIKSVNYALSNLKKWMASQKVHMPWAFFPSSAEVLPEPLGVVLIFSSWNFPIGLALEPLIGAISAGNVMVLKTAELAPASSNLIANILPLYLDHKAIKIVQGGQLVGEQLLDCKWDKIFFTGSERVGRIVMTRAAKHLTPVVLELGGKCPAIVDTLSNSRDLKVAVRRIVGGKWGPCCGQACIGVDYLLVEDKFASILIDLLRTAIKRFYVESDNISRIVNKQHFQRLCDLLNESSVRDSIAFGGSSDYETLVVEPTILVNPPLESLLMTEEIFGPLLPIITVKKIEESIEFICKRPKPLAIYAFTKNEHLKQRIIAETSSGSITFNDTMIQYACDALPFGGVGLSGFGKYHGKFSFDAFSHGKAILRRSFLIDFVCRYPPWNDMKLHFMRCLYRFDYIGLFLMCLGLKKG
ncbi:putative aldehyde dehydrogenase (NAD(P)(+)) [Dioscorea sansibarensis]